MVDKLILHGTILTMDSQRRIINDGAIAIEKDRILDVGTTKDLKAKFKAKNTIDASGKVVMPGLIDTHGHAGHSLVKTIAENEGDDWIPIIETFYKEATTPEYWYIDGILAALERLKFGTTCGLSYMGSSARTDDPIYALKHSLGTMEVGIRDVVAVGPGRPPYPNNFVKWEGEDASQKYQISYERNLEVIEEIIQELKNRNDSRTDIVMSPPYITIGSMTKDGQVQDLPDVQEKAEAIKRIIERLSLAVTPGFQAK